MRTVTQPTEKPAKYQEKFNAIKANMKESSKIKRLYSDEELNVMIKYSLIEEAKDKIEFSLRGQIKRGMPAKKGLSEQEFETTWRKKMQERLEMDGYPFELDKEEKVIFESLKEKKKKEAVEEVTKMTAAALKKILTSVE